MKRQKNLILTKKTETASEKELGEIDLTNLPEKEFKIKVTTMLMELQRKIQEIMESRDEDYRNKTISGRI